MDKWDKLFKQTHCDKCHKEVAKGEGMIAEGGFYHFKTCYQQLQQEYVDNYEWDEDETTSTNEMICPYCGDENTDSFEYGEDEGERVCGKCSREFNYIREITITYSTGRSEE